MSKTLEHATHLGATFGKNGNTTVVGTLFPMNARSQKLTKPGDTHYEWMYFTDLIINIS